jgi:hypothetical protein
MSTRRTPSQSASGYATEIPKPGYPGVLLSDDHIKAVRSEMARVTAQMSRAYSAMGRSEENLPRLAVSSTAIFIHRFSGPCRITSVTSHKWAAVLYSNSSNTNKAKKGRLLWAESAGA